MAFKTKQIKVDAWTATVTAEDLVNPSNVPAVRVVATIDVNGTPVIAEVTETLAPVDGGLGDMPADHVQRSLDAARNRAAKLAAFRANVQAQVAAAN